ncbi:MerR family transcriptional regulator [Bacillus sp. FJAT-52991]|uniref:MerR family transcriptional regulator n=1 Tax=Bacillus kandeliae TaxID=3129297 RepID=A0ABZ2N6T0_9BACI
MYSIGQFSKICEVPVKTIRYYSDIDLLVPSYIDPETNYRYYDHDKIQVMKKIKLLKSCQFTLAEIKEFVAEADPVKWNASIDYKIKQLENEREHLLQIIEEMKEWKSQIKSEGSILSSPCVTDCYLETQPEKKVFAIREKIEKKFINQLVKKLFDRIYAFNLRVDGPLMAVFHEKSLDQKEVDVELMLPVIASGHIEGMKILEEGLFACLTVKGSYSELEIGHHTLEDWIIEHGLTPLGPSIEIFEVGLVPAVVHPKDIKPDFDHHPSDYVTRICVLVCGA